MSEKLTRLTCEEFVNLLATKEPVPGGGGAAALVGALAVALGNMVGSLTVGKRKYARVEGEILALMARADGLQEKFLTMVERDAEAFAPLAAAYGLPAGEEKDQVMEQALAVAAAAPLEVMELSIHALEVIEGFARIGSRLAISDAGCAAALARAALSAASLNVEINTRLMKDGLRAERLNGSAAAYLSQGLAKADAIVEMVREQLK